MSEKIPPFQINPEAVYQLPHGLRFVFPSESLDQTTVPGYLRLSVFVDTEQNVCYETYDPETGEVGTKQSGYTTEDLEIVDEYVYEAPIGHSTADDEDLEIPF